MGIGKMIVAVVIGSAVAVVISQIPVVNCIPCLSALAGGGIAGLAYGLMRKPEATGMESGLLVGALAGFVGGLFAAVISIVLLGLGGLTLTVLGLPLLAEPELRILFGGLVAYELLIGIVTIAGILFSLVIDIVIGAVAGAIGAALVGGGAGTKPAA